PGPTGCQANTRWFSCCGTCRGSAEHPAVNLLGRRCPARTEPFSPVDPCRPPRMSYAAGPIGSLASRVLTSEVLNVMSASIEDLPVHSAPTGAGAATALVVRSQPATYDTVTGCAALSSACRSGSAHVPSAPITQSTAQNPATSQGRPSSAPVRAAATNGIPPPTTAP